MIIACGLRYISEKFLNEHLTVWKIFTCTFWFSILILLWMLCLFMLQSGSSSNALHAISGQYGVPVVSEVLAKLLTVGITDSGEYTCLL